MEAAVVSKDGQPRKATAEVGRKKVENQSGKENARTEGSEAGTGKTEVETAWVKKLQINLHQCKEPAIYLAGDCRKCKRRYAY